MAVTTSEWGRDPILMRHVVLSAGAATGELVEVEPGEMVFTRFEVRLLIPMRIMDRSNRRRADRMDGRGEGGWSGADPPQIWADRIMREGGGGEEVAF